MQEAGPCPPSPGGDHVVCFDTPQGEAIRAAGRFLVEGMQAGDPLILIAIPDDLDGLLGHLRRSSLDPEEARLRGRLHVKDARSTLDGVLAGGKPSWDRFADTVGRLVESAGLAAGDGRLRVYGGMADLLRREGKLDSALELESFWNHLLKRHRFSLLCGYGATPLDRAWGTAGFGAVLGPHTGYVRSAAPESLMQAVGGALQEVLGGESLGKLAPLFRAALRPGPRLPDPERALVWLCDHLPVYGAAVLERARTLHRPSLGGLSGD